MENFWQKFEDTAKRRANHPAIEVQRKDEVSRLPYAELHALAEVAAQRLAGRGLGARDRCAILASNDADWCAAYLGVLRLGAVAVPLDTNYKPGQVVTVIEDCQAGIVIAGEKFMGLAEQAAREASHTVEVIVLRTGAPERSGLLDGPFAPSGSLPACTSNRDDTAVLLYTSGTTSDPKGVVLTHGNLLVEVDIALDAIEIDERDKILGVLPLFHALAQVANLLLPLGVGATVVFLETLNTTELLRALREREITAFCCVPQFFYLIHQRIETQLQDSSWVVRKLFRTLLVSNGFLRDRFRINLGRLFFGRVHGVIGRSMRFLVTGGSRFEHSVGRAFYCMGFNILQAYGLTECTGGATLTRVGDGWTDSVGSPLPQVEVAILPDPEIPAGDHEVGEVALRGPNVMPGYYNRDDVNASVFSDGWFRTGDLGYMDNRGFLHITGRKKEMIVLSSGKNIYPEEVEAHYVRSPFIKELCVLGQSRPGEPSAERLHAVIVPDFDYLRSKNIVNAGEIIRFEIENLSVDMAAQKRILSYEIWSDELPRTTTRKLKRFAIEKMVRDRSTVADGQGAADREWSQDDRDWARMEEVAAILAEISAAKRTESVMHPDSNIELELGLDSMERVELLAHLEEKFSASVPEDLAAGIYTVRELVEAILASRGLTEKKSESKDKWATLLAAEEDDDEEWASQLATGPVTAVILYLILRMMYFTARIFLRFRVSGLEYLPAEGPYLLCPNHQSYLDAFLLSSALPYSHLRRSFFVGASEYFETPMMKRLARLANIVPVDPDANLLRAMEAGAYGLRRGRVLILFPEGERCIDGEIKKFKKGAAILSLNLQVPIVPVAFDGLYEVWPRQRGIQGLGRVSMRFGAPLAPVGDDMTDLRQSEAESRYGEAAYRLRETVIAMWQGMREARDPRFGQNDPSFQ